MAKKVTKVAKLNPDIEVVAGVTADASALARMLLAIGNAASAQRDRIRIAGPSCIEHAIQHGNCTYLTKLYEAIGSESRRRDFVMWCIEFAPVLWKEGKKADGATEQGSFGMDSKRKDEYSKRLAKDRVAFLAPLVKLPYWEWKAEPPIEALTIPQLLAAAVKKIDNTKADPKKAALPDNDFTGEADLRALAAKYPYVKKVKATTEAPTRH